MTTTLPVLVLTVLTLALALPAQCGGYWKAGFDVKGKSERHTTRSQYWDGPEDKHDWDAKNTMVDGIKKFKNGEGKITFTEGAGCDFIGYTADGQAHPVGTSTGTLEGAVTAVFTWVPDGNLQDDPPPSEIQFLEHASVGAGNMAGDVLAQKFPTYSRTAELVMGTLDTSTGKVESPDGISIGISNHVSVPNPGHLAVVHGPTRSFTASSIGSSPHSQFVGISHGAGMAYTIEFTRVYARTGLKLYKQDQDTGRFLPLESFTSANPASGGRIWVGLEIEYYGAHIKSDVKDVTVRIKEEEDPKLGNEPDSQHPENENHVDVRFPLSPKAGEGFKLQRCTDIEGFNWIDIDQLNGGQCRILWPWESQKIQEREGAKLWDHNGVHTVSVVKIGNKPAEGPGAGKIEFLPVENSDQYSVFAEKFPRRTLDVRNLIIKDVSSTTGNSDYFKFDPFNIKFGLSAPVIKFRIEDGGDNDSYEWRIRIRSTDKENESDSVVYMGSLENPGSVSLAINNGTIASDSPSQKLVDASTYNFQISVKGMKNEIPADTVNLRSRVFIPYKMPAPNQSKFGHDGKMVDGEDGKVRWYIYYFLKDDDSLYAQNRKVKVAAVKLEVLNPFFSKVAELSSGSSILPRSTNLPHMGENGEGIMVYEFPEENSLEEIRNSENGNPYIAILTAKDDYAICYRDHEARSLLAKNNQKTLKVRHGK